VPRGLSPRVAPDEAVALTIHNRPPKSPLLNLAIPTPPIRPRTPRPPHPPGLSRPLMRPGSMRAIASRLALGCSCRSDFNKPCRAASSSSRTHSCTLPRAMPKKFSRSGFVNHPLPSAILAAMEILRRRAAGVSETDGSLIARALHRRQSESCFVGSASSSSASVTTRTGGIRWKNLSPRSRTPLSDSVRNTSVCSCSSPAVKQSIAARSHVRRQGQLFVYSAKGAAQRW